MGGGGCLGSGCLVAWLLGCLVAWLLGTWDLGSGTWDAVTIAIGIGKWLLFNIDADHSHSDLTLGLYLVAWLLGTCEMVALEICERTLTSDSD
jgi:hypothetical protein